VNVLLENRYPRRIKCGASFSGHAQSLPQKQQHRKGFPSGVV
jgi:hypothetical protein